MKIKRIVGIILLSMILIATTSFAAYSSENENVISNDLELFTTLDVEEADEENEDYVIDSDSESIENLEEAIDYSEYQDEDLFQGGEEVKISNIYVDANAYIMAQNVVIENTDINGNLYVMAKNLEIRDSEIEGSIYALGENINVSSAANDVYILGKSLNMNDSACVWRNAKILAETLNINSYFGRDVMLGTENLTVGDNAVVEGDFVYTSENEGNISSNAQVPNLKFIEQEKLDKEDDNNDNNISFYFIIALSVILKSLIVSIILIKLTKKYAKVDNLKDVKTSLKTVGEGFAILVLVPVIAFLLLISIIGIGLSFTLMVIYAIVIYLATAILSLVVANKILENKGVTNKKLVGCAILVSLGLWLIGYIPGLGGIVKFITITMGVGITFDMIFKKEIKGEIAE